jgi:hypothetical protein
MTTIVLVVALSKYESQLDLASESDTIVGGQCLIYCDTDGVDSLLSRRQQTSH